MLNVIKMKVNGKEVELAVDPRESLLDTLRDRLGLTSVKRGCEVGECGAWALSLVDGEAIDSCIYLTMWAQGRQRADRGRAERAKRRVKPHTAGVYR